MQSSVAALQDTHLTVDSVSVNKTSSSKARSKSTESSCKAKIKHLTYTLEFAFEKVGTVLPSWITLAGQPMSPCDLSVRQLAQEILINQADKENASSFWVGSYRTD